MSYIDYANQFWQAVRTGSVPSSVVGVYFFLLHICNSNFWEMPFSCSTSLVCEKLCISRQTFITARRFLAELKLISFTEGSSRFSHPTYKFLQLTKDFTAQQTVEVTEDLTDDQTVELTDGMTHIYNKDIDNRLLKREMVTPSVSDIEAFMAGCDIPDGYELKEGLPQRFCDYYESKGWKIGNSPMTDWQATARKWTQDKQNLIKKNNGTDKRIKECGRVDNRAAARNFVEELEQRSLQSANRE